MYIYLPIDATMALSYYRRPFRIGTVTLSCWSTCAWLSLVKISASAAPASTRGMLENMTAAGFRRRDHAFGCRWKTQLNRGAASGDPKVDESAHACSIVHESSTSASLCTSASAVTSTSASNFVLHTYYFYSTQYRVFTRCSARSAAA